MMTMSASTMRRMRIRTVRKGVMMSGVKGVSSRTMPTTTTRAEPLTMSDGTHSAVPAEASNEAATMMMTLLFLPFPRE